MDSLYFKNILKKINFFLYHKIFFLIIKNKKIL
jgi:hypothetical protein